MCSHTGLPQPAGNTSPIPSLESRLSRKVAAKLAPITKVCIMLEGVQGAWLLEPFPGVSFRPQSATPIRPHGEKHWNVSKFRAVRAVATARFCSAQLSKSVELLPVANAKSNLVAELPSSEALPA